MSASKIFTFCLVLTAIVSVNIFSQDQFQPPKPLDNKVYESMIGSWEGESIMMGTPTRQEVTIEWILNKQFIQMHVKGYNKQSGEMAYEGMGLFGVDAKGDAMGWWFDNWGASAMSTGTGTFKDNMLDFKDANAMFKENRTFETKGSELIMKAKGSYTMKGQEIPFDESTTYKKK